MVLPHVMLVAATLLWTLTGAVVFYLIERPNELSLKRNASALVGRVALTLRLRWPGAGAVCCCTRGV